MNSAQHNHEKIESKDTGTVGIHKELKDQLVRSREAEKFDRCEVRLQQRI